MPVAKCYSTFSNACSVPASIVFFTFYRCRVARKQYLCHFIVTARRGNNIFAFYRHRAARKQYFRVSVLAASLRAIIFLFSPSQNGGTCWNGRGGAYVPARTSAQRRFHPKMRCCHPQMRCCHPQMLCFHLRKACFHVQTRCFYPREAPTNDGYALVGRAGGHTGTAPTNLHHIFPRNPT